MLAGVFIPVLSVYLGASVVATVGSPKLVSPSSTVLTSTLLEVSHSRALIAIRLIKLTHAEGDTHIVLNLRPAELPCDFTMVVLVSAQPDNICSVTDAVIYIVVKTSSSDELDCLKHVLVVKQAGVFVKATPDVFGVGTLAECSGICENIHGYE